MLLLVIRCHNPVVLIATDSNNIIKNYTLEMNYEMCV